MAENSKLQRSSYTSCEDEITDSSVSAFAHTPTPSTHPHTSNKDVHPSATPMTDRGSTSDGHNHASTPMVFHDVETPPPRIRVEYYKSLSSREVHVEGKVTLNIRFAFVDVKGQGVIFTDEWERAIQEEVVRRAKEIMDRCSEDEEIWVLKKL
jgi:hypothetical protein